MIVKSKLRWWYERIRLLPMYTFPSALCAQCRSICASELRTLCCPQTQEITGGFWMLWTFYEGGERIFGSLIFCFLSFLSSMIWCRISLTPVSTPAISNTAVAAVLPEWRYTSESAARWIWSEPFGIAFVKITCTLVSPFLCLKNSKNELKNQAAEWIKMRAIFCAQGWLFENWQKMLAVNPAL